MRLWVSSPWAGPAAPGLAGWLVLFMLLLSQTRPIPAQGIITTVAGTGTQDYSGDNGPATAAQLFNPSGVVLDASGTLFIADYANDRIRRVSPDGLITTVAGTRTYGYSGDNGPATAARLSFPTGVAVDASGNLFIADSRNHRIRRVAPNGIITTVAGTGVAGYSGDNGAATAAQLYNPRGVAVDASGNLFIADFNNNRIRRVSPSGTITTVAGTGSQGYSGDNGAATAAQLNLPYGVAVDASGTLFIADTFNHRIRKVAPNGIITTVAGTGTFGYNGDNGAATAAQLNSPFGVAVDASGNLFIADFNNNRIRRVSPNGTITTVAGTGTPAYSGDNGPATAARLNYPSGVAVDASGNLFIADQANNRIRRVTPAAFPTVTTTTPGALTNTAAQVGGTVVADGGAPVIERGVVYSSTNTTPTVGGTGVTQAVNGASTGTYSATLTGLSPGTTYYVRAYAINNQGASYGNVVSFTTVPVSVQAMVALTPTPTATTTVTYQVRFSGAIPGLNTSNFQFTNVTNLAPSVASVTGVGGSTAVYDVVVNTGALTNSASTGTLQLTVVNTTGTAPAITLPTPAAPLYTITRRFSAQPQLRLQGVGSASGQGDVTAFVDGVGVITSGTASTLPNALTNGSFETNTVSPSSYQYAGDVSAAPWRFGGSAGVARQGSLFGAAPSGNGDAVAFLQSSTRNTNDPSYLSQPLALPTGTYQLTFLASQRSFQGTTSDQVVQAFVNDVFVGSIQPTTTAGYQPFTSAPFAVTAVALTATVSTTASSPTSLSAIPFAVSFSQSVSSRFTASDVTIAGGTLTNGSFSGSGAGPYTFTVTPNGPGTVSVSLAAGVVQDANNTANAASNAVSVVYQPPVTPTPVVTTPAAGAQVGTATPTYSGTAAANSTVTVYVDNTSVGTTPASGLGSWSLTQPTGLTLGSHRVRATAQLAGQAVSGSSSETSFTVDAVDPTTIRYVNQDGTGNGLSWATASGNLQAMIDAQGVQQVWVAAGRYTRSGGGSFAMKNNVGIYGGFVGSEMSLASRPPVNPVAYQPSSTTLTVSGPGRVIENRTLTSTSILDGVVIAGGNSVFGGGGMDNYNSSPRVVNCLFQGNTADGGGAMFNNGSSPSLVNCLFQGNTASQTGGGVYTLSGSPSLINCSFQSNNATSGGGIWNNGSSLSLINCSFQGNTASQTAGGVYNLGGSPSLINCSFQANTASTQGGGMVTNNSNAQLINCSFRANTANQGGGIYNSRGNPNLTNCVLFDNGGGNTLVNVEEGSLRASYSLFDETVTGFTDGGNNLRTSVSPFVFSTLLKPCSGAINAGDNVAYAAANGPATDPANSPRFYQNGRIDMGAYEYPGAPTPSVAIARQPASSSSVTTGGSVSVPVSVSGSVNQYQWYKDNGNNPVSGQNSATLRLNNVQLSNAGAYSLVVTGDCNSVTSTAFSLTVVDPTPTLTGFAATPASVCAGSPVTFTATLGNVSGSYSFTLSNGTSLLTGTATGSPFSQTLAASGSNGQRFTLAVQAGNGPVATATTSLTVNAPFTVNLRPDGPLSCTRTSVTLTTGGGPSGATYVYSSGAQASAVSSATASVSQAGLYSVTATGPGGCSATATTQVQSDASAPGATLSAAPATTLSCAQTSLTLTAGGADTYQFSGPGLVSQRGNQAVVNAPGLYSVMVTRSSTGCTSTTSIAISQDNTAPAASLVSSGGLSCRATSVTLTAGPEGQAYRFSAGATPLGTTNRATVSSAGVYSVTVIGANGCTSVASTTVVGDQSAPVAGLTNDGPLSCTKTSVTLTASGVGTYQFSQGAIQINGGATASVSTAGVYSVTVVSANGCTATASTTVASDPSNLTASLTAPDYVCSGSGLALGVSVTGTAPFSYMWTSANGPGDQFVCGGTPTYPGLCADPSVNFSTTTSYSVVVTDANGCTVTAAKSVSAVTTPNTPALQGTPTLTSVPGGYTVSVTSGTPVSLSALVQGGPSGAYAWRLNGVQTASTSFAYTVPGASLTIPGTYVVSVRKADGNPNAACDSAPASVTITVSPAPLVSVTPPSLTFINSTQLPGSNPQVYSVSARNLTVSQLLITAPAPYVISVTPGSFGQSQVLPVTNGAVAPTSVTVALVSSQAGTFDGTITNGAGSASATVALSGTTLSPSLSVTPTALSGFSTTEGTPSGVQTYTITALSQTGGYATAPTGVEIRTGANAFGSAVTIPASLSVLNIPVDVRLSGAAVGPVTGSIMHQLNNSSNQSVATVAISGTVSATVPAAVLRVLHRDVDNYADNNAVQPTLQLVNEGVGSLPLSAITLRYYLTVEGAAPLSVLSINYAQLGDRNVRLRYVPLDPARQGATGYVEYSFTPEAGSLAPGANSGNIQSYFAKADYSFLNELDDYSYAPVRDQLVANPRITAYDNGALIWGQEPSGNVGCPAISLTASNNGTLSCSQPSLILTANGGQTYVFSSGTTPVSANQVSVSREGVYSVTATSANGCVDVASVRVAAPAALPTPDFTTRGNAATADGLTSVTVGQNSPPVRFGAPNCSGTLSWSGNGLSGTGVLDAPTASPGVFVYQATCRVGNCVSGPASVTVSVLEAPVNRPPVAVANADQVATVGVPFTYTVNAFTDEQPASLDYSATLAPVNGLTFNPATRVISGTPSVSGVSTITITATDPGNLTASTSFVLTVSPAPVVVTPLALSLTASPTQLLTSGSTSLSATVSGGTTPYRYVFTGPGTITQTSASNTASVGGLSAGVQTFTVVVSDATSPVSLTSSATVSVTVSVANTAPTVASAISSQTATVGQSYSLNLASTFTDQQTPNSLTLSASGLPAGLSLVGTTLSGTPSVSGVSTVVVTATDPGSLSASTRFVLTVSPAPATRTALRVLHRDVDNYADNNAVQPTLQLVNEGTDPLPLSAITLRYYLTVEGTTPLSVLSINYAQVGDRNVRLRYVPLNPNRQGATGYVEYSFTPEAGSLAPGANSGNIQSYFAKADYSFLNELDDYSYAPVRDQLVANSRITAYDNGVLIWGQEPASGARQAVAEPVSPLTVTLLGNPVREDRVSFEVSGGGAAPLQLQLTTLQGRVLDQQQVVSPLATDRYQLSVAGQSAGVFLLQVSTTTQRQTVKVIKEN